MSKTAIRVLLHDQTIGYHPILAVIGGGAAEGVLLRQLLHWDGVMSNARGDDWDGWFWKVAEEIYTETGMRRSEFETARANLIKRGLIDLQKRGVPNRAHYRVNLDAIEQALENSSDFQRQYSRQAPERPQTDEESQNVNPDAEPQNLSLSKMDKLETPTNQIAENGQTSLPKMDKPDCAKSADLSAENRQTIHKSTTSDYQKKKKYISLPKATFPVENPDGEGFAALMKDIQARVTNLSPNMAQRVGELWDDFPELDAHIHAMQQVDKFANGFNLTYYERCLDSWWAKHKKGKENGTGNAIH